jgi:hypothetical protein
MGSHTKYNRAHSIHVEAVHMLAELWQNLPNRVLLILVNLLRIILW